MIDTKDLTSYIPGYDDYCNSKNEPIPSDYSGDLADEYHEEMMLKEETLKMERKIIDLNTTNMTFDEVMNLRDYIWKNDKLIPETIECE